MKPNYSTIYVLTQNISLHCQSCRIRSCGHHPWPKPLIFLIFSFQNSVLPALSTKVEFRIKHIPTISIYFIKYEPWLTTYIIWIKERKFKIDLFIFFVRYNCDHENEDISIFRVTLIEMYRAIYIQYLMPIQAWFDI